MRVNGKIDGNVEVTPQELVKVIKKEVFSRLKLPNQEGIVFVKNGRWKHKKMAYTTHAFEIEEDLGPAKKDDVEVFDSFYTMAEFLNDTV